MPFNADTYRANKHRRKAWQHLAEAREVKARVLNGTAYDWERPRVAFLVSMARSSMKLHRLYKLTAGG